MRPRHLEIVGFGAFARRTTVDFDLLAEAGLFHIGGPTGAGKTTLIDAMCFALYGRVPGAREADHLATHHASAQPEVTLEFSAGGHDWRVTRTPRRERAKRRGTGTTVEPSRATLLRRSETMWKPIATGPSEVDREIKGLLGLDAVQFQQVVVLPQGEFEKVLRADAVERERLLSSLFATARFGDLTESLRDSAKELVASCGREGDRLASIERQTRERAEDAGLEASATLPLDVLATTAAASAEHLYRVVSAARTSHREAVEAAERASRLTVAIARRDGAIEKARALDGLQPAIDELVSRLGEHHRAAPVHDRHRALTDAIGRRVQALDAVGVAELAVEALATSPSLSALLPPVAVDTLYVAHLESARGQVAEAKAAAAEVEAERASFEEAAVEVAALIDQASRHGEALESTRERAADLATELAAVRALANAAPGLRIELDGLMARMRDIEMLGTARVHLKAARVGAEALEGEATRSSKAHLDTIEGRIAGMAGELAAALREGEACSVCGSAEHPAPAGEGHRVTADDIEAAASASATARAAAAAARESVAALASQVATLSSTTDGIDLPGIRRRMKSAEDALAEATAASQRALELDAEAAQLATAIKGHDAALAAINIRHAGAEAGLRSSKTRVARAEARLAPLGITDPSAATTAFEQLCVSLETRQGARLRLEHLDAEVHRARGALIEALASSGHGSVEHAVAAVLTADEVERLDFEVAAHQAEVAAVNVVLDDPMLKALPAAPPDASVAEALARRAEAHLEASLRAHALAESAATDLGRLARRHGELEAARGPRVLEAERLQRLAELCHGTNPLRLSLERFVLAAYLDEIAEAASAHLAEMTSGRFRLRHSEARVRGNAGAGLSLLVGDSLTGTEREVGTLSGGETFLASLALALGVAEVVQRHAGGVRIDALFIDEGFGSLDPESLDLALQVLDDLREGGRLVGVVSHVAALREAIGIGIEVIPSPTGSTAVLTGPAA
ncbi:MAG TPA: SMC family ATPase [Acidimicrobiales bacterium]|nr:SMC family ATPase [Acidimicrobiales bacterium]